MKQGPALINIGFGNVVVASKVVAVVSPGSAPMKRLRDEARSAGRLVDATEGRRTRSIIVTDSGHIILSAIQPETIAAKFARPGESPEATGREDEGE
jgi:regulator of extracellular matrix RemA (YlzA/DUF370 family)